MLGLFGRRALRPSAAGALAKRAPTAPMLSRITCRATAAAPVLRAHTSLVACRIAPARRAPSLLRVAPGAAQFGGKPGFESLTVSLPPRSTLVLRGVSADECQHAINAVAERRISILLRRAKPGGAPAAAAPPRRPRRA